MEKIYLIAGGDLRSIHLAKLLTGQGKVYAVGLECPEGPANIRFLSSLSELKEQPDFLILPIPITKDGATLSAPMSREVLRISHLLDLCHPNTLVFGGMADDQFQEECRARNLTFYDLTKREEFAVYNAVPTAEGALQMALEALPETLSGKEVLITGYGKTAKLCRRVFAAMNCRVTVAARSIRDRAWAEADGADAVSLKDMKLCLPRQQIILNTVPSLLFPEEQLRLMQPGTLLLDLASAPGGTDFAAAEKLGIQAVHALSLPGKTAPATAAKAIAQTISGILSEGGNIHV